MAHRRAYRDPYSNGLLPGSAGARWLNRGVNDQGLEGSSLRSPRVWLAFAAVTFTYFITDWTEGALYRPLVHAIGLHRSAPNTLGSGTYGALMLVRLFSNGLVWLALCKVLAQSPLIFLLGRKRLTRYTATGLGTRLALMS